MCLCYDALFSWQFLRTDYDSIGGYIIQLLDHLPSVGDTASDGVISCKVTKLDKNRVSRVLLEILPKPNTGIDSNNE